IEADVPLLGELGAKADEPMVGPVVDEIVEPIVEMEEQVIALVIDVEEDLAMLFGDDDISDDDSEGFEDKEVVCEVNEEWLMAPVTPPSMPVVPPPSTYEVGGPSTVAAKGQSCTLPTLGFPVLSSVIEDLSARMGADFAGRCAAERCTEQLQIMVSEMSSRESTLMKNHVMSDKSSPFKMSSFGKLFELDYSKEKSVLTPATDYCASNPTPIDCMERVSSLSYRGVNRTPTLRRDFLENVKFPRWVETTVVSSEAESEDGEDFSDDQVDYAIRGAETLELELRSFSNEQRAHDAQLFS
nr:hypothetical protein [Tanacetum cinerariifolium]